MSGQEDRFSEERAIAEEHSAIRAIMNWISADLDRQSAAAESVSDDGPLLGPLRAFQDHLRRHFEFEEQSGVLPAAIALQSKVTLAEWEGQHADILARLEGAIRALEQATRAGTAAPDDLGSRIRALFADLGRHEALENELLGDARIGEFRARQHGFEQAGPL